MLTEEILREEYEKLADSSKKIIAYIAKQIRETIGVIRLEYEIDIFKLAINILDMPRDKDIYTFLDDIIDIAMKETMIINTEKCYTRYAWFSYFSFDGATTIGIKLSPLLNLYMIAKLFGDEDL